MSNLVYLDKYLCLVGSSVCYTVGAYSKWLDASSSGQSILPSVIDILMSGMSTSEDSAAAAALAFRHICAGTESP